MNVKKKAHDSSPLWPLEMLLWDPKTFIVILMEKNGTSSETTKKRGGNYIDIQNIINGSDHTAEPANVKTRDEWKFKWNAKMEKKELSSGKLGGRGD